jgi:hypothetical protein
MAGNHLHMRSGKQLFTSHGTMIFVDTVSGELRHGPTVGSPCNVVLEREGDLARVRFSDADGRREFVFQPECSYLVSSDNVLANEATVAAHTLFTCAVTGESEFGLTAGGKFLCAEPDGRITLSRSLCGTWERFHTRAEASASSGLVANRSIEKQKVPFQQPTTLVEHIRLLPVHGAAVRMQNDGLLILKDGKNLDWHLLRWTDPRLNGVRVKLKVVLKPADSCDTDLYVHHWGGKDVCSINKDCTIVLNEGAEEILIDKLPDDFISVTIIFENRHPTLSLGTGKPRGRYHGTGADQYLFKSIEVELLPLNPTRKAIIDQLWQGSDPFCDLPNNLFEYDLTGWNSQHSYLRDTIAELRPTLIVEIGVWKGGSTVFMANELKAHALSSVVIAVDTWSGSSEHWTGPSRADLSFFGGRPNLYHKFLSNVIRAKVGDYVVPLPVDSLNAAQILGASNLKPQMIHLDGGHDYESVMADLRAWWPILAPGGIFIGDDYYIEGAWTMVRKAFDDFFYTLNLIPIENIGGKCRVRKPD